MNQVLERHSVSDAKENLSGLIANVEASGIPFVISRYGKPVAIVSSYDGDIKVAAKMKGALHSYANTSLVSLEKQAWRNAACKK